MDYGGAVGAPAGDVCRATIVVGKRVALPRSDATWACEKGAGACMEQVGPDES